MKIHILFTTALCLAACQSQSLRDATPVVHSAALRDDLTDVEARGTQNAIATQGIASTRAATAILQQGGNLVDAAIAASFTLAVERPQSTGLAGGGFFLFHQASTGQDFAVDFRERAPAGAKRDMYLNAQGNPDSKLSRNGILAVGVPGLVAGLCEIHARFGHLPLKAVLAPAIDLAERGFPIYPHLHEALKIRALTLSGDPAARALFLDEKGEAWPVGHLLVQKDLAQSLRLIAQNGPRVFYRGALARKIVAYSKAHKGLLNAKDLADYKVHWRTPVRGHFHGNEIVSMPPPSSGGVHVIQFLQFLDHDDLKSAGPLSVASLHLAASALQDAFADRARYLGDPDFVDIPVKGLLSEKYSQERRAQIPPDRARRADEVQAGNPLNFESDETTHLSLMDAEGNAVSSTQTVNGYMGAAVVVPGTGLLLNNEMDDFSAQAGTQNMYGAVGSEANSIAPHKTPLSSMSPTFVIRDGRVQMALGAPGGTRIISCVAQTILNKVEFGMSLYDSIAAVRYHDQWRPDQLEIEAPGPQASVVQQLQKMGYNVLIRPVPCQVTAVAREEGGLHAVSDPRDIGTSAAQ